jgi:hypothetical protein
MLFHAVTIGAVTAPVSPARGEEASKELIKKIESAVVTVYCYDKTGKPSHQGSGFLFKTDRRLITNYHVLGDVGMAKVKTANGKEYNVKSIEGEDRESDLIGAEIDIPYNTMEFLTQAPAPAKPGDAVIVVGSPLGVEKTVSTGRVEAVQEIAGHGKLIVYSAHSFHGSSGSPLVNTRGEVVGVVSAGIEGNPNVNFAVPVERISEMKSAWKRMGGPIKAAGGSEEGGDAAIERLKRLANAGDPEAQVELAIMYELGKGVDKSNCNAFDLYRKAAEKGHVPAAYHMGRMFQEGKCANQNFAEAARWFRKGAEQGLADAQCGLGVLYFNGEGVSRDRAQACMWMILAASRGSSDARNRLRLFSAELTPDEMQQAQELVKKWRPAR